tara:strand:+ start:4208 stop:4648 length:441 start_codon:yes stop_codon:yes gene_type:complete
MTPTTLELCSGLPVKTYAQGAEIIREHQKDGVLYILKRGAVEISKRHTEVNRAASPGSIFGEVSVLLDIPHTATVTALEPCEFYLAEDGAAFLFQHPELNLRIARLLAHRLHQSTEKVVELREFIEASDDAYGHVSGVLNSLVEQW